MNAHFARTLSLLRREKKLSQKHCAGKLGISQALLSHYENGIREPGLNFVVAAADFYDVSADYLLGRTLSRDGTGIHVDQLHDASLEHDGTLKGSSMSLFSKKILMNAISVLFNLLGLSENRALVSEGYGYLGAAVYKLFRATYLRSMGNDAFFTAPRSSYSDACDAHLKLCECRFRAALDSHEGDFPLITNDSLTRDYPLLAQSLLSVVHATEQQLAPLLPDKSK